MGPTTGLLSILILHIVYPVSSLTCLSCRGIFQPRHCHNVIECLPNERCSVQRYVDTRGLINYNVGCETQERCMQHTDGSHSNSRCDECCNTTLCNAKGCGEPGYPSSGGPICFKCDQIPADRNCYTITACEQGEVCVVEEAEEFGDIMVSTGCLHQKECGNTIGGPYIPSLVGKRDAAYRRNINSNCKQCCNGTLCNRQCVEPGSSLTQLPTQTTSTAQTTTQTVYQRDCLDILSQNSSAQTGAYTINHRTLGSLVLWCDMRTDGGGWTVFDRRFNGSVDFYRNFSSYQNGFGNANGGEFWLGLDNIYAMTKDSYNMLRVEATEFDGTFLYDQYANFSIGPSRKYTLHVSGHSGNGTDEMISSFNGQAFTTMDVDQDMGGINCAETYRGAFWFNRCYTYTHINGIYQPGVVSSSQTNSYTMTYRNRTGALAITLMLKRH